MKAYKIEILVIDYDDIGQKGIERQIEDMDYPNGSVSPVIYGIEEAEIGKWSADHPLNLKNVDHRREYERLFGPK